MNPSTDRTPEQAGGEIVGGAVATVKTAALGVTAAAGKPTEKGLVG
jgi:hypothetical protein